MQVTFGTTTAVKPIFLVDDQAEEMSKVATDWIGDLWEIPAIPEILAF